jgi:pimeloyl-ACP methyl ester carboxylesterase
MQRNFRFQNKLINYWIEGDGPAVMLVHGFAEDHRVWQYQADFLKKNYRLIIPDLPGSGASELLPHTSMESMSGALFAIVEKESIDSLSLIGHSMGGYISLAFAAQFNDRLNSLCLFHSTAFADSEEKKQTRAKAIEFIKKNGVEEFLRTTTPNLFAKGDAKSGEGQLKNEMVRKVVDDYKYLPAESLIAYYEAMMKRPDRTDVLKSFIKPILLLLGRHDTAVPYEQGIQQSKLSRMTEVHTLESSGHMGMWEQTAESNDVLAGFVKNNVR